MKRYAGVTISGLVQKKNLPGKPKGVRTDTK